MYLETENVDIHGTELWVSESICLLACAPGAVWFQVGFFTRLWNKRTMELNVDQTSGHVPWFSYLLKAVGRELGPEFASLSTLFLCMCLSCAVKIYLFICYLFIYLFIRQRERERSPMCWFISQMPITVGAGLSESQKTQNSIPVSYTGGREPTP